jgi:hypothetical protein
MGLWTEAVITCELKPDVPPQVIRILNYLINPIEDPSRIDTPAHPFFKQAQWFATLAMDGAYFPGETVSVFRPPDHSDTYHLTLRCKVKYGDLLTALLHWLAPYVATQGFLGYRRPDEYDEITLIYARNNNAFYAKVPSLQQTEITEEMFKP